MLFTSSMRIQCFSIVYPLDRLKLLKADTALKAETKESLIGAILKVYDSVEYNKVWFKESK